MNKWEYFTDIVSIDDLYKPNKLNNLGEQGWEIITLDRLRDSPIEYLVVFKKLISE